MEPLKPWMRWLLRFVGCYNLLAGLGMMVFYHEGFKLLGVPKPQLMLPLQLVGILVGLFGVGYLMVSFEELHELGERRRRLDLDATSAVFKRDRYLSHWRDLSISLWRAADSCAQHSGQLVSDAISISFSIC